MKHPIFFLVVLIGLTSYSQKRMTKTLSTKNIEVINFKFNQINTINLSTHDSPTIKITAIVKGDNSENIILTNRKYANGLYISSDFQSALKNLSTNKVTTTELIIAIPKNMTAYLKSDIANLKVHGGYKKLTLELSDGSCDIIEFSGNALINTIDGNIRVQTDFADIQAVSKHGKTNLEELTIGNNKLVLNSVNGDIRVNKSKE